MNNNLKITVTTNVQQANSSLKQFQQTLQGTGNVVSRVGRIFDKQGNLISQTIATTEKTGNKLYRTIQRLDGNGTLRNLSQSVSEVKSETGKATNAFSKLKSAINFGAILVGFKTIGKIIGTTTTNAVDYSESLNLFNVVFDNIESKGKTVFSEVGKEATKFQEKLQRNFGANRTESMYFQGLYQSMAESQGIADKYANIMSENSTKLTYDLSSLFNKNQEDTAEALRAGIYAGQTKPLRSYGIDITETSLQKTLAKLQETNSSLSNLQVSTMSQAEKQILRYLSVLDQASVAQGDFANTMESPANQMKIFTNQIAEMGVAIGNLFIGPLQRILTFANTIVIVVKQVAQAISSLLGIKIGDYNTGIASAEDLSDAYESVGDSAGNASKKIKELNRQTLAFDNINNINEAKDNQSGSGSGSVNGGINQALLDALKGYDNGLDKVKLKAQQIADQIMKWLGFTYDAEEGTWKLGSAYDNVISSCKNLRNALKVLGKYSFENLTNFYETFLKPLAKWTLGTGLPKFVDITANGILKTDWANLNAKLNNFYKALEPFAIHVGEGLLWFYEKVLVPLGSFTIGQVVPEFVQLLASGLNILNSTIEIFKPTATFLWDNFLSPIASWTGGVIVDILKGLNSVLELISKNKAATILTNIAVSFLLIKNRGTILNTVLGKLPKSFQLIFANGEKTAEILGDKKATGLSKIILGLKTAIFNLLSPLKNLKNALNDVNYSGKTTFQGISEGINSWSSQLSKLDKLKVTLLGIAGTAISLQGVSSAIKNISDEGFNAQNAVELLGSSLGTIASTTTIGAQFGGLGAGIGAVAGAVLELETVLDSMPTKYEKISREIESNCEKIDKQVIKIKEQRTAIEETMNSELSSIEVHKNLYKELTSIVDANGKIKSGYEDRASFIVQELNRAYGTEYKVVNGVIQKYGELKQSVQELIDKKTAEIVLQHKEQEYYNAYDKKISLEKDMVKARKGLSEAQNNLNEALTIYNQKSVALAGDPYAGGYLAMLKEDVENAEKAVQKATETYNNSAEEYAQAVTNIEDYQALLVAITNENYDEMNKIVENWGTKNYSTFAETLTKQTNELNGGEMSKGLKEAWKYLAQQDYEAYANAISPMDETTRKNIQKITGVVIEKTPEVEKTADNLGTKMIKKMKKDEEAKQTGIKIISDYIAGLSKSDQKKLLEQCGVDNASKVISGLKKDGSLSEEVGMQVIQGLKKGLDNNYWQGQTLSSASIFANSILGQWKNIFGIHSPSHETEYFAIQLLKGFGVGISDEKKETFQIAKNFSKDLLTNMSLNNSDIKNSLSLDATKYVNFSEVKGSIKNNLKTSFDKDFIGQLGLAIADAINDRPIDINIDARVEEGIIVDTAVKGINNILETTGECPIRVM